MPAAREMSDSIEP